MTLLLALYLRDSGERVATITVYGTVPRPDDLIEVDDIRYRVDRVKWLDRHGVYHPILWVEQHSIVAGRNA